jgi:prepilin-type N-terminal cleavage/methylation domain-containing protein
MKSYKEERNEQGFTLIELLVAIVVVGILTAVAIVGIAGLTDGGKSAACQTSVDAAHAASAIYYSNHKAYATTIQELVDEKDLDLQGGVTVADAVMNSGTDWTVTMSGGDAVPNTFTACP